MSIPEVFIVSAARTAIGTFGGTLKDVPLTRLATLAVTEALKRSGLPAADIGHVVMGNVIPTEPRDAYLARRLDQVYDGAPPMEKFDDDPGDAPAAAPTPAPSGRVASWNTGAERLKGYTAAQIVGQHFAVFYPPEVAASGAAERELDEAIANGRFEDEGWRMRADGSRFWANVVLTPLRDDSGQLRGFSKVTRDLSKRRAVELALRDSEQRYRQVVEDQTEVVCRFLADGTFTFVNDVYCRTFGRTTEELLGKTWQPMVEAADLPLVQAKLAEMSPDNPVVRIENRVHDGQGRVRWMEFVNRGFYGEEGTLKEVQAVGRDVTDRRAAEEARRELEISLREKEQQSRYERQIMQSQKLESLGVLAGGIAHDFNNLLAVVSGNLQLALMQSGVPNEARECLQEIRKASDRACGLVKQILTFSRNDALRYGEGLAMGLFAETALAHRSIIAVAVARMKPRSGAIRVSRECIYPRFRCAASELLAVYTERH